MFENLNKYIDTAKNTVRENAASLSEKVGALRKDANEFASSAINSGTKTVVKYKNKAFEKIYEATKKSPKERIAELYTEMSKLEEEIPEIEKSIKSNELDFRTVARAKNAIGSNMMKSISMSEINKLKNELSSKKERIENIKELIEYFKKQL